MDLQDEITWLNNKLWETQSYYNDVTFKYEKKLQDYEHQMKVASSKIDKCKKLLIEKDVPITLILDILTSIQFEMRDNRFHLKVDNPEK